MNTLRRPRRDHVRVHIQKCSEEWIQDTGHGYKGSACERMGEKGRKLCNKTLNPILLPLHMKFKSNLLQIFLRSITFISNIQCTLKYKENNI